MARFPFPASQRLALCALLTSATAPVVRSQTVEPPTEPTLGELVRLVETQRVLLDEQARLLATQGQRIDALEKRLAEGGAVPAASAPAPGVAAQADILEKTPSLQVKDISAEFPRAFKIPGTDAALRIGGQVRLVDVHNIGAVGTDDRFVTSSTSTCGRRAAWDTCARSWRRTSRARAGASACGTPTASGAAW
jgi:hypothetical protein